ncbi:MAG: flagellar basal body-associated FliL family protein [Myxococcota bacterium]
MAAEIEEEPKAAKGGRLKLVAVAAVLLLGGGGAGFGAAWFLAGSSDAKAAEHGEGAEGEGEEGGEGEAAAEGEGHGEEAAAEEGGHGEEAAAEEGGGHGGGGEGAPAPKPKARAVVNLGTFTVNLRGSGGGRVLRTEVQVEVAGKDEASVEEKKPQLRDAVITLASDFTYGDLEGVDGKTHLRDELLGRLNTLLEGKPNVGRVYFTEFVVQ